MVRKLLKYVGVYKKAALATPAFIIGEVVMETLIPFIIALLIDRGITAGDMSNVLKYGGLMLAVAFASLLFGVLAGRSSAYASTGFACNLRDAMYKHIQEFSFSNIDKFSTAGLITRMTTDITNVQNAFQMILRIAVRAPFILISSLVMAFIINRELSFIFLVVLVCLAVILFLIMRHIIPVFSEVFKKYDALNSSVQENVNGIRVVKAFAREDHETKKFNKATLGLYKLFVKAEGFLAINSPIMLTAVFGSMIAISWIGAHFIVFGTLTTGELTSMFSYLMSCLMSLMMVSMVFVMISMSLASVRRISEVLDEQPSIVNPEQPIMEVPDGSIRFDHVSFSYSSDADEETLHDINLDIRSGETIGIIGATGSGKSTLVSLASRLYDVSSGAVLVGGHDVRSYDLTVLRDAVSVVLQKNVLFSGTILDNLRWGNEDATDEECIEACKRAYADGFISEFPDGYDTRIERGGANVSGGQKQRLCIARALLKNPKVLILDDSTSAVDTATDAMIRESFRRAIPGTTKLIISQRVSSVEDADRIIVLDEGRVDGFDTHERLLETNEIYRSIYELQTQGGGDFDKLESAEEGSERQMRDAGNGGSNAASEPDTSVRPETGSSSPDFTPEGGDRQ